MLRITATPLRKNKNHYCDRKCSGNGRRAGDNPDLKGGYQDRNGYWVVNINGRHHLKHRVVMERLLGRPLTSEEHVHHMNGIRDDNRPENLTVVSKHDHPTQTLRLIQELQERIRILENTLDASRAA